MSDFHIFRHASLLLHCTARETNGGTNDRVIDAFASFEGLALPYIEDDRLSCPIGVLMAFDDGAAQTPFERPSGHLAPQPSQKFDIWSVKKLFGSS